MSWKALITVSFYSRGPRCFKTCYPLWTSYMKV
uniref:Uncharacterized protein n=1 Tax=Anguilla anguilla TaxID=7936 RepID=A0A0E9UV98_ANGAN